jgi:DNA-binding NarL/FixJ family response regulator
MIVYCCADLIFATKVRSTCDALSATSRPARNAQMLQKRLDRVDDGKPNDAVALLLIDLDLGEPALELISQARSHDAELPIIAWGPHVAVDLLNRAGQAGASEVMTRGSFTSKLPEIVQQFNSSD